MQVSIELPDDMADQICHKVPDISRRILEAFAIDSYRQGLLTGLQVRRLLGLETRFDLERLLQRAKLTHEYTDEELDQDFQNSRRLSSRLHDRT